MQENKSGFFLSTVYKGENPPATVDLKNADNIQGSGVSTCIVTKNVSYPQGIRWLRLELWLGL